MQAAVLGFHLTESEISTSLAITAIGLSLTATAAHYIIVTSSPKEFMSISVGVGALLFFIGMAIGPTLSGVLMQSNHIPNEDAGGALGASYPTLQSYNMIFFATGLLATVSLAFFVMLAKGLPMQKVGGDALAKH